MSREFPIPFFLRLPSASPPSLGLDRQGVLVLLAALGFFFCLDSELADRKSADGTESHAPVALTLGKCRDYP